MTSMSTEWNGEKCLEWHTQLPLADQSKTSPVFLFQNQECYFYFCRSPGLTWDFSMKCWRGFYEVYLKTSKAENKNLESFSMTIFVNYDGAKNSSGYTRCRATFYNCDEPVFSFSELYYTTKAINLSYGFSIRFLFMFQHSVTDLLLPSEAKREDKSIQTGSYLNAKVSVESMTDDFTQLLETGLHHDAEIKSGEHSLKVHKAVLCARSEVFKTMLQSDFREGQTGVVKIHDMDACFFQHFMQYMYTGSLPELNFEEAKALYEVGDKYAIKSLMFRCSEYLQDSLSQENVFECFLLGDAHSDEKLKDKIQAYILEKEVYLDEEYWAHFCEKFPKMAAQVCSLSHRKKKKMENE